MLKLETWGKNKEILCKLESLLDTRSQDSSTKKQSLQIHLNAKPKKSHFVITGPMFSPINILLRLTNQPVSILWKLSHANLP